jgi:hypothetical protein
VKYRKPISYAFSAGELDAVETLEGSDGALIVGGPGARFTAVSAAKAREMALSLTALYLELDAREARNTRSVAYTDPDTKESRIAELSTEKFRSFLWMIGADKPKPVCHFIRTDVYGDLECACGYIPAITGVCASFTFREAQRLAVKNHIKEQRSVAVRAILLPVMLTAVFIVLKLTGAVGWDWVWVTCPLWLPIVIPLIMALCVLVGIGMVVVTAAIFAFIGSILE